jgi:DNA-binding XRE family transcriptional regulator
MRNATYIVTIHSIKDYTLTCLFNNGESRKIDFKALFARWKIKEGHPAFPLTQEVNAFQQVKVADGSLVWENITFESEDEDGNPLLQHFDLDPIVLYQESTPDPDRKLHVGWMIRQARLEKGMTQSELAQKTGTSKHYISRIENEKSGIELSTLKKIAEGLGKRLLITMEDAPMS